MLTLSIPPALLLRNNIKNRVFVDAFSIINRNTNYRSIITIQQSTRRLLLSSSSSLSSSKRTIMMMSTKATISERSSSSSSNNNNNNNNEKEIMDNILYRIRQMNYYPNNLDVLHFYVDNIHLGTVRPSIAQLLCDSGTAFEIINDDDNSNKILTLSKKNAGTTYESRTNAVMNVMETLRNNGIIDGWRDELYPVSDSFYNTPVFSMERAAVPYLGVLEYGVHMNGIVHINDNDNNTSKENIRMWLGRRSKTKSKYPNMLDHIAAGGQPINISLYDNVIKECYEEAGIPTHITKSSMKSVSVVSYKRYNNKKDTIERVILFNYDLLLPNTFQPKPIDGEVQEFILYTIDDLLQTMDPNYHDPIKPNCYPVIIDFLLRYGYISPDIPGYLDVIRELRNGDCR